ETFDKSQSASLHHDVQDEDEDYSSLSSLSLVSLLTSLTSLDSEDPEVKGVVQGHSSGCPSKSEDEDNCYLHCLNNIQAYIKYLMETHVLELNCIHKLSQLYFVLVLYKQYDSKHFRKNLHVASETFDQLLKKIADNLVFISTGSHEQIPVDEQLTVALYCFGHFRNTTSVEAIGQWAGVSAGAVVACTCHVMQAILVLHNDVICWSSPAKREAAKEWVEAASCVAWHNGWLLVDSTLVPLTEKPGHHREAYFDCKSNYSLNVQLITLPNLHIVDYVVGHCSSAHDSTVFMASLTFQDHQNLLFFLRERDQKLIIWANPAYPVEAWCVTPYKKLTSNVHDNKFFNFWVSHICIHLGHAVGLFKGQFQSLKGLQQQIKNNQDHLHTLEWIHTRIIPHNLIHKFEHGQAEEESE
ncbi:hypothetical protein AN958_06426, partial [Leucoagaricus sp. SymC.cos]